MRAYIMARASSAGCEICTSLRSGLVSSAKQTNPVLSQSLSVTSNMNNADLYATANGLQRRDAEDVIREFFHRVRWSPGGGDHILDVGCGDGDVMTNVLQKHLPRNFGKLVGSDLSSKMIEYANTIYRSSKIEFHVMDIASELNFDERGSYDHLFSFNCLHWVQDQRSAIRNINALLKPGGDCVLSFMAKNEIFSVYRILAANSRWTTYMQDFAKYVSPYHYSSNPEEEFTNLMFESGFKNVHVEYKQKTFYFHGTQTLRDSVSAVNPFLERIPANLHEAFFDDYLDAVRALGLVDGGNNNMGDKPTFRAPYGFIVAYAMK